MRPYALFMAKVAERDTVADVASFLTRANPRPASAASVLPGAGVDALLFPHVIRGSARAIERALRAMYRLPESGTTTSI